MRVLDIAAGHGLFGITIAQRTPQAQIVAVDWAGVLKLVSTRPVRGSTQHFYGMSIEAEWAQAVLALDEREGDPQGEEIA